MLILSGHGSCPAELCLAMVGQALIMYDEAHCTAVAAGQV